MTVVAFSMAYRSFRGGAGRLHTRLDTPPLINRRHPDSCLAPSLSSRCSIGSPEHLVPGTAPVSSRCLQAPAGDHGPVLNQAIEYRSNAQSAIISAFQLSAIFAKPSTATAAPTPNPHSRQALTAFPRVRSSEAFRRRPLYRVDRSRRAGIRNPSRFRTLGRGEVPRTHSPTGDLRRDE